MKLEDVMLSEISRHERTISIRFHLLEVPSVVRVIEAESGIMLARS